jgi:segregation and condensation protein B
VTTEGFLQLSGLDSLRDLPDFDRIEEAGLLGKTPLPSELRSALGLPDETEAETEDREEADDDYVAAWTPTVQTGFGSER